MKSRRGSKRRRRKKHSKRKKRHLRKRKRKSGRRKHQTKRREPFKVEWTTERRAKLRRMIVRGDLIGVDDPGLLELAGLTREEAERYEHAALKRDAELAGHGWLFGPKVER